MDITTAEIDRLKQQYGFRGPALEKALRLLYLLQSLYQRSYWRDNFALRGGTALHMFYLDLKRLSVDIDLAYTGRQEPPGRQDIDEALRAALGTGWIGLRQRLTRHPHPSTLHWRVAYKSVARETEYPLDFIAIDITVHSDLLLYAPQERTSHALGQQQACGIRVADPYEVAAGKMNALIGRREVRDLYDASALHRSGWDKKRMQQVFLAVNEAKGRNVHAMQPQGLAVNPDFVRTDLLPLLQSGTCENEPAALAAFADAMQQDAEQLLRCMLGERTIG